jgi:hypothetical protein
MSQQLFHLSINKIKLSVAMGQYPNRVICHLLHDLATAVGPGDVSGLALVQ